MPFGFMWEESLVSRSLAFWDGSPLVGASSSGIVVYFSCDVCNISEGVVER